MDVYNYIHENVHYNIVIEHAAEEQMEILIGYSLGCYKIYTPMARYINHVATETKVSN